jgi:nitroreductase
VQNPEVSQEMDLATVDELLTTTRAVRKRLDLTRPVPDAVILECLRLAIQAPTGSNAQLWRWIVVTDRDVRAELARLYRYTDDAPRAIQLPDVPQSPQQDRVTESARYLSEHLHEVPALVIACTEEKGGAAGWPPSIYPAVWSFMLALRSRGLGSCITTAHLHHREEADALLDIPDGFVQACLIPVAYYTGTGFRPAERRPVEEVTYWDRWGHSVRLESRSDQVDRR